MTLNDLGKFPIDGNVARREAKFYKVTPETALKVIHGKDHPVPLTFFFSNDLGHLGELSIPAGGSRATESDMHKGDAVLYVTSGPVTFCLPDTREVFEVNEGDAMFIPEGTKYQCINYTNKVLKLIFLIAPGM